MPQPFARRWGACVLIVHTLDCRRARLQRQLARLQDRIDALEQVCVCVCVAAGTHTPCQAGIVQSQWRSHHPPAGQTNHLCLTRPAQEAARLAAAESEAGDVHRTGQEKLQAEVLRQLEAHCGHLRQLRADKLREQEQQQQ